MPPQTRELMLQRAARIVRRKHKGQWSPKARRAYLGVLKAAFPPRPGVQVGYDVTFRIGNSVTQWAAVEFTREGGEA